MRGIIQVDGQLSGKTWGDGVSELPGITRGRSRTRGCVCDRRWMGGQWEAGMLRVVEGTVSGTMTLDCCLVTFLICFLCGPGDKNSGKPDLIKVPMIIMDWEKCSKLFSKLTKNMLCAGYENESYDACQVTKGHPLPHSIDPHPLRDADAGHPLSTGNKQ